MGNGWWGDGSNYGKYRDEGGRPVGDGVNTMLKWRNPGSAALDPFCWLTYHYFAIMRSCILRTRAGVIEMDATSSPARRSRRADCSVAQCGLAHCVCRHRAHRRVGRRVRVSRVPGSWFPVSRLRAGRVALSRRTFQRVDADGLAGPSGWGRRGSASGLPGGRSPATGCPSAVQPRARAASDCCLSARFGRRYPSAASRSQPVAALQRQPVAGSRRKQASASWREPAAAASGVCPVAAPAGGRWR